MEYFWLKATDGRLSWLNLRLVHTLPLRSTELIHATQAHSPLLDNDGVNRNHMVRDQCILVEGLEGLQT